MLEFKKHKLDKILPSPFDPRDIYFSNKMCSTISLPDSIDLACRIKRIENQQNLGTCTGMGGSTMMEILETFDNKPHIELSPLYLYYKAREIEGTVNFDNGAYLRDTMKVLQKNGICEEKYFPFIIKDFAKKPSQEAELNAKNHMIEGYQRLNSVNQIKSLCDMVHPKYGILTKIGTAHIEIFGSQENIQKGKFELIESLPSDGIGVLNGDDELQVNYKLKNNCKIIWIGIDNKNVDVRATDIKTSNKGTTFNVIFKGDKKKYQFTTKLLGYNNIYNILASLALSKEFGLTIEQMKKAVLGVRSVEHRLELRPAGNITYIDDSYNSNPVGSKMALDVLKDMPGLRIVMTPGMVELGNKSYELNKKFGIFMKDTCDVVILVGEKITKPIKDGLKEVKFNNKVFFFELANAIANWFDT